MKILVVDNQDELREDLEREAGKIKESEVFSADNAEKAIEIIQKHDIDLVITDLWMEEETAGLNVLKAAKEKDILTQVILVTAYGKKDSKIGAQAMGIGAYDFITRSDPNIDYLAVLHHMILHALEYRNSKRIGTS